jgi:O-antigen ligase
MLQFRRLAAPAFLFLCLLAGGSAQSIWGNAALRLVAALLIVWAIISRPAEPQPRRTRQLSWIAGLAVALGLLQLVPLPIAVWSSLPGREGVLAGFRLLALEPGPMPISLAPYDTVSTLLALLPPLAVLALIFSFRETSRRWLAAALVAGTFAGVLLGILQVSSSNPAASPWYLYRVSNFGAPTGFFANSNHMASLLLVSIPFIAALGVTVSDRTEDVKKRSAVLAMTGGGLLLATFGIVLNGSLAGLGLGVPVLLLSILMLIGPGSRLARGMKLVGGIALLAAVGLLWASPVGGRLGGAAASVQSRSTIVEHSLELVARYAPAGSGIGTFEKVYRAGEDPLLVNRSYVNHAHNDYVEIAVEAGLPGTILVLLFLGWWALAVRDMLRSPVSDQFAMAGAIASAAVLMHSLVDYPLRTAAISSAFAMCLAMIVVSRRRAKSESDLRPARHLTVG